MDNYDNWRKSDRSNGSGQCVEVASADRTVAVRDTVSRDGVTLGFSTGAWTAFLATVRLPVEGRPPAALGWPGFFIAPAWTNLMRSNGSGSSIETAGNGSIVAVRDTIDRDGGTRVFTADAWSKFTGTLR